MEISTEVLHAHRQLSESSVKFLEYVDQNPEALKRSNYCRFDEYISSPKTVIQPWPLFVNKTRRKAMEKAAVDVLNLIIQIPQKIFNNNPHEISNYFHIPVEQVNLLLSGTQPVHLHDYISRGDFILSPSGFKCLEYNLSTILGGIEISIWERVYLDTLIISEFLKQNKINILNQNIVYVLCEHLIDKALENFANEDEINTVLLVPNFHAGSKIPPIVMFMSSVYNHLLQQKRLNLKGNVFYTNYDHQFQVKKDQVFFQGKRIHTLIEFYNQFAPSEILKVYQAGNVLLLNGPAHHLLGSKLNLALLSEYQDSGLFNQQERKLIEKYIPWSRHVTDMETTYENQEINLKDFMLDNKDKLVLKPAYGLGGIDVFIGRHVGDSQWRALIESTVKNANHGGNENSNNNLNVPLNNWSQSDEPVFGVNKWLVQEYVQSRPYLFQRGEEGCAEHHIVWGFFVFGSTYSGGWVRLLPVTSDQGIINRNQGAEECVVFEVDE